MTQRFLSLSARTAFILASGLTLWSCDPDNDNDASPAGSNVFIVQEGNFTRSNSEIVGFNSSVSAITNAALFRSVNNRILGDVAQSMTVVGNLGYIVVNNSNKVEVVSLPDFNDQATIDIFAKAPVAPDTVTRLILPRYFAASNKKGYVSQTVNYDVPNGRVSVIDLATNQVTKTIPVGKQPEQMAVVGNKLFVSNNGSNTVSVINTLTDSVEATITVADSPASMVVDKNNALWVMCSGQSTYSSTPPYAPIVTVPGSLVRIDPATNAVTATLRFAAGQQAGGLRINGAKDQLFFRRQSGVYRMSITDTALPTAPLFQRRGGFYGLDVDPRTGLIYGSPENFTGTARFFRYQTTGQVIDSFTIGTSANSFVFYN
ncbi:hypothetical protein F1C16_14710 [Hymenobacter sp. NBH84]|uniref:DUF5074 domain-containing protein n=1 Tax=Hymenobacter sp. NBH84 TaxID=2596915 RepID=UPI001623D62A|nr:DUF5074 domain-containing protein [Hymenobacter sp. NBH84]QNE40727.1 hypothetical protein F1C16_14710 [Hymenobacter sp. NBH84]